MVSAGRIPRALSSLLGGGEKSDDAALSLSNGRAAIPTADSANVVLEMQDLSVTASPTVLEDEAGGPSSEEQHRSVRISELSEMSGVSQQSTAVNGRSSCHRSSANRSSEQRSCRTTDASRFKSSKGIIRKSSKGGPSADGGPAMGPSEIKVVLLDEVEAALLGPNASPSSVMDDLYAANFCVALPEGVVVALVSYRQARAAGDAYTMDYDSLLRLLRAARSVGADAIWSANTPCPPLPCMIPRMRSHADHHLPGSTSGATSSAATRMTTTTLCSCSRRWRLPYLLPSTTAAAAAAATSPLTLLLHPSSLLTQVASRVDNVVWLGIARRHTDALYQYRLWCSFEAAVVQVRKLHVARADEQLTLLQRRQKRWGSFGYLFPWERGDGVVDELYRANADYYLFMCFLLSVLPYYLVCIGIGSASPYNGQAKRTIAAGAPPFPRSSPSPLPSSSPPPLLLPSHPSSTLAQAPSSSSARPRCSTRPSGCSAAAARCRGRSAASRSTGRPCCASWTNDTPRGTRSASRSRSTTCCPACRGCRAPSESRARTLLRSSPLRSLIRRLTHLSLQVPRPARRPRGGRRAGAVVGRSALGLAQGGAAMRELPSNRLASS